MSMVMYLRRAGDANIARIGEDEEAAVRFVFEEGDASCDLVDFDVAWAAIHFMLCGAAYDGDHPLGIVAGRLPEHGVDADGNVGFWVISPKTMKRFAGALESLSDEDLISRYDPPAWLAAGIHRGEMLAEDDEEDHAGTLAYVLQSVPRLRQLASSCAAAGDGALRILR